MLAKFYQRFLKIDTITGADVKVQADGSQAVSGACLSYKKNVVSVLNYIDETVSVEAFVSVLPVNIPLAISISGRGILYKKLTNAGALTDSAKVIKAVLPDASVNDFYWQIFEENTHKHVFIVRKSLVDSIITNFKQKGHDIISVTLGPWSIVKTDTIISIFNTLGTVSIAGHNFLFSDRILDSYKYNQPNEALSSLSIKIGDDAVAAEKLTAYCNAFQQFLPNPVGVQDTAITSWKDEYMQRLWFPKLGWAILIFFLVALLVNFMAFNHYHDTYQQVSYTQEQSRGQLEKFKELQDKWKEKEQFITASNWLAPSRISLYADCIAAGVPPSITLTELSVNPIDEKELKEKKVFLFKSGYIRASGQCKHSVELNRWIKKLTDYDFIEKVDVVNYYMDGGESLGTFVVEMKIKES